MLTKNQKAILSNADGFTSFNYGGYNMRFRTLYSLERYVDVMSWDDGYHVVQAIFVHTAELEEECK